MSRILLIGDSISEGYFPFVKDMLAGTASVHRPDENCGSTLFGLERLDDWLGSTEWDVIHFNWGLHDLRHVDENGEFALVPKGRHFVPLPEYEKNLHSLVQRLKKTGAELIWATSTPVPEGCSWRIEDEEKLFNDVASRVMQEEGVPIDDLHQIVEPRLEEFQDRNDVHFNSGGSEFLAKEVCKVLQEALGRRSRSSVDLWQVEGARRLSQS